MASAHVICSTVQPSRVGIVGRGSRAASRSRIASDGRPTRGSVFGRRTGALSAGATAITARQAVRIDRLAAGAAGGSDLGSGMGALGRSGHRRPHPRGGLRRYGNGRVHRHLGVILGLSRAGVLLSSARGRVRLLRSSSIMTAQARVSLALSCRGVAGWRRRPDIHRRPADRLNLTFAAARL